jgi:hypothetical protein
MLIASPRKLAPVVATIAALAFSGLLGCGSDREDDPATAVQAACNSSCQASAGSCNLAITANECASLCGLGYTLAPACATTYQDYVHCAGASPLLECTGSSITVDVGAPCLDKLGNYLSCAVGHISACFELPLDDAACTQAKMGPHARACIGTQVGCTLLTGTVQAGGIGVFCCP